MYEASTEQELLELAEKFITNKYRIAARQRRARSRLAGNGAFHAGSPSMLQVLQGIAPKLD